MISDPKKIVSQRWEIKPQSLAIQASVITVRPPRRPDHCHINIFIEIISTTICLNSNSLQSVFMLWSSKNPEDMHNLVV